MGGALGGGTLGGTLGGILGAGQRAPRVCVAGLLFDLGLIGVHPSQVLLVVVPIYGSSLYGGGVCMEQCVMVGQCVVGQRPFNEGGKLFLCDVPIAVLVHCIEHLPATTLPHGASACSRHKPALVCRGTHPVQSTQPCSPALSHVHLLWEGGGPQEARHGRDEGLRARHKGSEACIYTGEEEDAEGQAIGGTRTLQSEQQAPPQRVVPASQ